VKFSETIQEALHMEPERPASMVGIEQLPKRFELMPRDVVRLKAYIESHV
jgi:threonine synthase